MYGTQIRESNTKINSTKEERSPFHDLGCGFACKAKEIGKVGAGHKMIPLLVISIFHPAPKSCQS
jgi:hypothetical protein